METEQEKTAAMYQDVRGFRRKAPPGITSDMR